MEYGAREGIRTLEPLQDGILSPAPLSDSATLAYNRRLHFLLKRHTVVFGKSPIPRKHGIENNDWEIYPQEHTDDDDLQHTGRREGR
jgi:hypothetical protein